ncbi:ferritin-like domain-containing protein [Suillus subalutaceus]|uniref:ferritin-like domain-containing protein n=1 Tax=Suillus subalutaceus TaxID=48586 RepID=UPI001B886D3E|nr:ferritin-like domain-containing protein [Suillus subalutaceus]KAG1840191.1 ferritin-like domain-containing protein [Suillus subalutaceus]
MKLAAASLTLLVVAALPELCVAAPAKRDDSSTPTDIQILNFALTLEHLENAFYIQGLQKYTQQDFLDADLPTWARGRWDEISQHESTHVSFLESVIGDQAVQPCTYSFPDTDPMTFVTTSFMLETVGVSAYSGAAQFLSESDYITGSAAILAVEARQSAWINSAVLKANPWNTAFDTPLDLNHVWTLASGVIVSCPSSNMPLPVKAFPALSFPAGAQPGQTVQVSFNATTTSEQLYVAFIAGLGATFVPLSSQNTVDIPSTLLGVVFPVITSSNDTVTDNVTIAGPAFLSFDFNSDGKDELSR